MYSVPIRSSSSFFRFVNLSHLVFLSLITYLLYSTQHSFVQSFYYLARGVIMKFFILPRSFICFSFRKTVYLRPVMFASSLSCIYLRVFLPRSFCLYLLHALFLSCTVFLLAYSFLFPISIVCSFSYSFSLPFSFALTRLPGLVHLDSLVRLRVFPRLLSRGRAPQVRNAVELFDV